MLDPIAYAAAVALALLLAGVFVAIGLVIVDEVRRR